MITLPQLDSPLPTLYYCRDYLGELEEAQLLQEIHTSRARWKEVSGRRLQVGAGGLRTVSSEQCGKS